MTEARLNLLVLETGTIAAWQGDDVDNGWALTAREARAIADRCANAAEIGGRATVTLGETEDGTIEVAGDADVMTTIAGGLRRAADQAEAKTATKQ